MFNWLFGGSKTADKTVNTLADGLYNGIDKLVYTDEEKADARRQAFDSWLKMVEITRDENSARSVARRIIAVMVMTVWLMLIIAGAIAYPWLPKYSGFLFSLVTDMLWIVGSIVVFYFGTTMIGRMKGTFGHNKKG